MDHARDLLYLVARQAVDDGAISDATTAAEDAPSCDTGNEYNGKMGLRISAIFVILVGSTMGSFRRCLTRPTCAC